MPTPTSTNNYSINLYSPLPVPNRTLEYPSIRDEVRRTIHEHGFKPSPTHYTSISTIYNLFLAQTSQQHSEKMETNFRSALGRVLRPPKTSDEYAKSYAVPTLRRWNGYISVVAPGITCIDPRKEQILKKAEHGERNRIDARTSTRIKELRDQRRRKKETNEVIEEEEAQVTSFRYVDEFMGLDCAEDLLRLKLFPNGKEMAESMSAYAMVRNYLHIHTEEHPEQDGILSFKDHRVLLLAVGDGVTPRTASMFAFRSNWRCVSIDPVMRKGEWDRDVRRLTTISKKVQDATVPVKEHERVVVIMWHCHCSIADALACLDFDGDGGKWDISDKERSEQLRKRVAVVCCSCCNWEKEHLQMPDGNPSDVKVEDPAVPGLKRTVRIWKFKT